MNNMVKGGILIAAGIGAVSLSMYLKSTGAATSRAGTVATACTAVAGAGSLIMGIVKVGRNF